LIFYHTTGIAQMLCVSATIVAMFV